MINSVFKMDHIKPAIELSASQTLKELSSLEFQNVLKSWLEEKGVVRDLRAFVKYQMINVLKNTVIGKNIIKNNGKEVTLSKQALHLIVAEYLMQNNCYYSLSIFSNEVNITNILPERSIFEAERIKTSMRFSLENVINILELVGISRNTETYKEILDSYFGNTPDVTILSCLLDIVNTDRKKASTYKKEDELLLNDFICENDNFKITAQLLLKIVPPKTCYEILNILKSSIEHQRRNIEDYYSRIIYELNEELQMKEQKIEDFSKVKTFLEKKIVKTAEEHKRIKKKIQNLKDKKVTESAKEDKKCSLNHCSNECSKCILKHCTEQCSQTKAHLEKYRSDTQILEHLVENQKTEIKRLNERCKELINEFSVCHSKINLLNEKISKENRTELRSTINSNESSDHLETRVNEDTELVYSDKNYSSSPLSITEEILHQAKLKLVELEKESMEIDSRFKNYLIT